MLELYFMGFFSGLLEYEGNGNYRDCWLEIFRFSGLGTELSVPNILRTDSIAYSRDGPDMEQRFEPILCSLHQVHASILRLVFSYINNK